MSESAPPRASLLGSSAPVMVLLGLVIAGAAWLLPINLTSVSPALLRAAGARTPTLGSYGRDLVDAEKIGAASMILAAAKAVDDPRSPALAAAIEQFATGQAGLVAWGGWDPFLDPLFKLRENKGRRGSTPVLTFFISERSRQALRSYLANSGSDAVQAILRLRQLTNTGRFVPALRAGGQPLDALILLTALLYQGNHLSAPLQRELRGAVTAALRDQDLGELSAFLVDLLSLGRRLDWGQLAELGRRADSTKTVGEFAHLARVAPDQLPLIYAAALFSDSADRVATYLLEYGKAGLQDLTLALGLGQGAVRQLLLRQAPVNRTASPTLSAGAEMVLTHPQLMLALKYLGLFVGVWLVLRGLDRWILTPGAGPSLPASLGRMKSGVLSLLFAVLLIAITEPFLLKAAAPSEFRPRLPVLVSISNSPVSPPPQPTTTTMDASTLLSIGFFAALQVAVYFFCLLKIREIAAHPLSPLVKLRLMENEENLFDAGLYVGIGGTATALVLQVLGVIEPNLLAAYSSNLFGITCVALVKIRHVRPYKHQLILDGQADIARAAPESAISGGRRSDVV